MFKGESESESGLELQTQGFLYLVSESTRRVGATRRLSEGVRDGYGSKRWGNARTRTASVLPCAAHRMLGAIDDRGPILFGSKKGFEFCVRDATERKNKDVAKRGGLRDPASDSVCWLSSPFAISRRWPGPCDCHMDCLTTVADDPTAHFYAYRRSLSPRRCQSRVTPQTSLLNREQGAKSNYSLPGKEKFEHRMLNRGTASLTQHLDRSQKKQRRLQSLEAWS